MVDQRTFLAQALDYTDLTSNVAAANAQVVSVVYSDGDAGDFNWHNPLNWNGDFVPSAADLAAIDRPDSETIMITNANATVAGLRSTASY